MTYESETNLVNALKRAKSGKVVAKRTINKTTGGTMFYCLSRTATNEAGYPVYHLLTVDARGCIHCPCQHGRKAGNVCIHEAAAFKVLYPRHNIFMRYRGIA